MTPPGVMNIHLYTSIRQLLCLNIILAVLQSSYTQSYIQSLQNGYPKKNSILTLSATTRKGGEKGVGAGFGSRDPGRGGAFSIF